MYRQFLTFAVVFLVLGLTSAPAMSQSREETVDFLFRGGRVETSDMKIYIANDATIKEESCVIDISGKIDGSRFAKYSAGKAPNPLASLGGHAYEIKIDFNKLLPMYFVLSRQKYGAEAKILGEKGALEAVLPQVTNEKEITAMGAAYSGTPPPQIRDGVANSSSELILGYLEDDVGEQKLARLPNAFKYFIADFCPGKKSAY